MAPLSLQWTLGGGLGEEEEEEQLLIGTTMTFHLADAQLSLPIHPF